MRTAMFFLLLGACAAAPEKKTTVPRKLPPVRAGMPEGYRAVGKPRVEPAFLEPRAAWRALRSLVLMLQAEAVARNLGIMVTFQASRVHATTRAGARRTWELPKGLRLAGGPVHLLLSGDHGVRLFRGDHSEVPLGDEVTVVTARLGAPGRDLEEFRLTIKGGRTIRSISTAG